MLRFRRDCHIVNLLKRTIKFNSQRINFLKRWSLNELLLLGQLDRETEFKCNITSPMRLRIIYQLATGIIKQKSFMVPSGVRLLA